MLVWKKLLCISKPVLYVMLHAGWIVCEGLSQFMCVFLALLRVTYTHFCVFAHRHQSLPLNLKYLSLFHKLIFRAFAWCALLWCTTASSPFLWLKEWQMCKCFSLSSVYGTSNWNEKCQCQCRSVRLSESLRHIHSLLSCVVETIMSAETLISTSHLREYVYFIYMTCHVSAYEMEGCIT